MSELKDTMDYINSQENKKRISGDTARYLVYNGQLRKYVEEAIRKEFLLPETINDLIARIVPLNIVQKIVDKLSVTYMNGAKRVAGNDNEADDELLDLFVTDMEFNNKMKHANRFFKLHKHTALEPFLDRNGFPKTRALPSQTYTVFSDDPIQPEVPTRFIKHVNVVDDKSKCRYHYWTDNEFLILDGTGNPVLSEMREINNEEGINPFGVIPYTYINSSQDLLRPVSDDDLITMQIIINLLLSDLVFASKFQAWSIITIIGAESDTVRLNPNSVITLPDGASINTIKPQLDINEMLSFIESLVALLLTTKNLSVGTVTGQLQADQAASGVAKLIDRAETTEDRQDQISFFKQAEREYWFKFAHNVLPVWIQENRIRPEYAVNFSEDFFLSINFPEPRAYLGEKERLEIEIAKLNMGLTSKKKAMENLNPDATEEEVDALMMEIEEEQDVQARGFREISETDDQSDESA